jgi:hypothetical protein
MAEHTRRWYVTRFAVAAFAAAVTYYAIELVMPSWFQELPKPLPEVLAHPVVDAILEIGLSLAYGLIAWLGVGIFVASVLICSLYSIIAYTLVDNLYASIGYGLWAGAVISFFITSLQFFMEAPWEEGYDNEEFGPDPGGMWPFVIILQFLFSVTMLLMISFLHGIIPWNSLEGRRGWIIFISAATFIGGVLAIILSSGQNRQYSGAAKRERDIEK